MIALIDTERQPAQLLDRLCRSILTPRSSRGIDSRFKICDDCGECVEDSEPEFTLQADATPGDPNTGVKPDIVFVLRTRYSYVSCSSCGNARLPAPLLPHPQQQQSRAGDRLTSASNAAAAATTATAAAAAAAGRRSVSGPGTPTPSISAGGGASTGEAICPVHVQLVYRYTTCEADDKMTKVYVVHCPDCGAASSELPTYAAVQQYITGHLSTAQHDSSSKLAQAAAAGAYNVPADRVAGQMCARAAATAAVYILSTTLQAAGLPIRPRFWGTNTKPTATNSEAVCAAGSGPNAVPTDLNQQQQVQQLQDQPPKQQQQQSLLPWRIWAATRLSHSEELVRVANWARPSLHRLDRLADPDRPAASILDVLFSAPYPGALRGSKVQYYAGGGLSKLAALLCRKRGALLAGGTSRKRRRKSVQQQQQQEGIEQGHADVTDVNSPAGAGAGAAAPAVPSMTAVEVLSLLLSEDPLFAHLPPQQRLPTFLDLAQIGSEPDIDIATNSAAMVEGGSPHMAPCGACGRTKKVLARAGESARLRKCSYCCAVVCEACWAELVGAGGEPAAQEMTSAGTAAAAAVVAAAPPAAASEAWPFGLCPWCDGHPDTEHIRGGRGDSSDSGQQQQGRLTLRQHRQAAAAAAGKPRGVDPHSPVSSNVGDKSRSPAAATAAGGGGGGGGTGIVTSGGRRRQSAKAAAGTASDAAAPAAAAGAAKPGTAPTAAGAAPGADQANWPWHTGSLTVPEVESYAAVLNMSQAQKEHLIIFRRNSGNPWRLANPGSVAGLPAGYLVLEAGRVDGDRVDKHYLSPEGRWLRSIAEAQRDAARLETNTQANSAAAAAAATAAGLGEVQDTVAVQDQQQVDTPAAAAAAGAPEQQQLVLGQQPTPSRSRKRHGCELGQRPIQLAPVAAADAAGAADAAAAAAAGASDGAAADATRCGRAQQPRLAGMCHVHGAGVQPCESADDSDDSLSSQQQHQQQQQGHMPDEVPNQLPQLLLRPPQQQQQPRQQLLRQGGRQEGHSKERPLMQQQQQVDGAPSDPPIHFPLPQGYQLPQVDNLHARESRVALSASLLKLFNAIRTGLSVQQQHQQPLQQQQQQQLRMMLQRLQDLKSKLLGPGKSSDADTAVGQQAWHEQLLLNYGFLQSWVELRDWQQVQEAFITLLTEAAA